VRPLDKSRLPSLTFPSVEYGARETPWNLGVLVYQGGAGARADKVEQLIADGMLGPPDRSRIDLVTKMHEELNGDLLSGGSRATAHTRITALRGFFAWADKTGSDLTMEGVVETYLAWTDFLVHRRRLKSVSARHRDPKRRAHGTSALSEHSSYALGAVVGALLDRILHSGAMLLRRTRLNARVRRKGAVGVEAEKQNLASTMTFGHLLQDICDGLPIEVVMKAMPPVRLTLRDARTIKLPGRSSPRVWQEKGVLGDRHPLINLRIEAELHMFIGQTGMNLEQAYNLELREFAYLSHLDGYLVKERKARRGGDVLFEIYKDYRPHFSRYLDWRRRLFPDAKRVFPFICFRGRRPNATFRGNRMRRICRQLGVAYIAPAKLRNTRVNWLLRRSGDPSLTTEMAQHTMKVLLPVYARPSLQRAMSETMQFWGKFDPCVVREPAAGPGECVGNPEAQSSTPASAPRPDCHKPSGCLWCVNHRDVDSRDYVWLLATFRYLKTVELHVSRGRLSDCGALPALHVIDRLSKKLRWFETSNTKRHEWFIDALERVEDSDFHPEWRHAIDACEGRT